MNLWKKALCKALISSRKIMKLQSFESGVSDVITTNVENFSPLIFIFLLIL